MEPNQNGTQNTEDTNPMRQGQTAEETRKTAQNQQEAETEKAENATQAPAGQAAPAAPPVQPSPGPEPGPDAQSGPDAQAASAAPAAPGPENQPGPQSGPNAQAAPAAHPAQPAPGPENQPGPQSGPNEQAASATPAAPATPSFAPGTPPAAPVAPIPPAYGYWPPPEKPPRQPLNATAADGWFAFTSIFLGFLFIRWFFILPEGWGVTGFTALFAAAVLLFARHKNIRPQADSWFWLGILSLTALSCGLWPGEAMLAWRALLLFGAAVYWCGQVFGILVKTKTSNYLPLDALNLLVLVPFKNYGTWFKSILKLKGDAKSAQGAPGGDVAGAAQGAKAAPKKHPVLSVLLAVVLFVPLLAVILPLLLEADGGNFSSLLSDLNELLAKWFDFSVWEWFWQFLLGIPVALFICGLVLGAAHKRYTRNFDTQKADQNLGYLKLIPELTASTLLFLTAAVYVVFIGCQLPYFFSAFAGVRPQGFEVYSEYARSGFFELCRIAFINLGMMLALGVFCRVKMRSSRKLKTANILLSCLTVLLILTALSKMALYIQAYGLSTLRLTTSVFMLFLMAVCVAVVVLQFRAFSIARFGLGLGATMLCLLCLLNPNGLVARYNAGRYVNGTLPEFDTSVLWYAGYDGLAAGLKVYENSGNPEQKDKIIHILDHMQRDAEYKKGTSRDCLSYALVRGVDLPGCEHDTE